MTLPETITTPHGTYEQGIIEGIYVNEHRQAVDIANPGSGKAWVFSKHMSPDEIIEFLQAYKEATNE